MSFLNELIYRNVGFWPIAAVQHFPKADTRTAGFGKSRRSTRAVSFGREIDILSGKYWPKSVIRIQCVTTPKVTGFRSKSGKVTELIVL